MRPSSPFLSKPFVTTGLLVLGVLFSYLFLPPTPGVDESVQALLWGSVFLILVPMLHVRLVLKRPISSMGFTRTARRFGLPAVFLSVVSLLSVWFLILRLYEVRTLYSLSPAVRESFPWFLFYETALVGTVSLIYETFFRGLVMLSWLSGFGVVSVFLQSGIQVVFLGLTGGFVWQNVPMMLAGLASGFVGYYTRSLWYSWMTAWMTMFLADVLFLVFG